MIKIILTIEKTEARPEKMRVALHNGFFIVQTYSLKIERWVTQAEHQQEKAALIDCVNWY